MFRKINILHFTCAGIILGGYVLGAPVADAQQSSVTTTPSASQTAEVSSANNVDREKINDHEGSDLPDSPGTMSSGVAHSPSDGNSRNPFDTQLASPSLYLVAQSQPQQQQQDQQEQDQQQAAPIQKPVGTAAAENPNASGIAASQPAGAAVAPARQHRVRTIVLRTGAIVGAAVAVGTVVALTAGTSSKPPGAH